jgi:ankyrin repeat protein
MQGSEDSVRVLLEHGANPSEARPREFDAVTPLQIAVCNEHPKLVRLLIDAGCDIDARDAHGQTALMHAACMGFSAIAETLIRSGASGEIADNQRYRPIDVAVEKKDAEMCRVLRGAESASSNDRATVGGEAPPGWFPDPTGRHDHRYWDGRVWTSAVSDRGVQSQDPV